MNEKSGNEKSGKGKIRKILSLAALGALGAWLLRRKRAGKSSEPEGTWQDLGETGSDPS